MIIAIDIGGTKTLVAAYSDDGEILRSDKKPTNPEYKAFKKELIETIEHLAENEPIDAICVAAPGRIDYETGVVISLGNLGWQAVPIRDDLLNHFEVDVHIDNDANLGAIGEANMGAGKDYKSVLYITVSTGIGTGVAYNGKLQDVLRKSEGGSMHFMHEGRLTKWEHFASGKAFLERFGKMGKDVDDPEIWGQFAEDLSLGFSALIAIIEPDIVVVGGGMGDHLEKYHSQLVAMMQHTRSSVVAVPSIIEARYPENAVINGCYILCKQHSQD